MREAGVFTGISTSPSSWLRQRPNRYTIRAGRNLPDKEFRYLRTVIVTAAVYRGFGSKRELFPLTFRHRAGVSPYTSSYDFAETCVFSKQSLGPGHCDPNQLIPQGNHQSGHSFSRSYGAILPSSLTRTHSSTLGFSPHLPVSVYGTVSSNSHLEGFLGSLIRVSLCPRGSYSPLDVKKQRICLLFPSTGLNHHPSGG